MQEPRVKSLLVSVVAFFCLAASAQTPEYVAPADAGPHGSAPGMQVKLIATASPSGPTEYAVIFRAGDEPYAGLTQFAAEHHVHSAHFTAIGGFSDARLAWFDLDKKMFRVIPIDAQVEVVSLTGDIALLDGKPQVHMHCVVAFPDGATRGGHILGAHVSPLLEVFVTADPVILAKKRDPTRGLTLISPDAKP
jgi:uncharacterized protein